MSYAKAMKHSRNVRKMKKQKNMYLGFDTGTGHFAEPANIRELNCQRREVGEWFASRHEGDRQYNRECVREAVIRLRELQLSLVKHA